MKNLKALFLLQMMNNNLNKKNNKKKKKILILQKHKCLDTIAKKKINMLSPKIMFVMTNLILMILILLKRLKSIFKKSKKRINNKITNFLRVKLLKPEKISNFIKGRVFTIFIFIYL